MSNRFALPVSLDVAGRRCLVLGGGPEATDKARRLVRAGGAVQVIADQVEEALAAMAEAGELGWAARSWVPADIRGAFLVFVTPDERERAAEAHELAEAQGAHICAIDVPDHCTFATPAVVEVGDLRIALSSGGRTPSLLRRLREDLERALATEAMRGLVAELGALRDRTPRAERRARLSQATAGFRLDVSVTFPGWFSDPDGRDDEDDEDDDDEAPARDEAPDWLERDAPGPGDEPDRS
jgi:precorrin-2 dehydrogenase/sirohydrochlorin ferrochelatase